MNKFAITALLITLSYPAAAETFVFHNKSQSPVVSPSTEAGLYTCRDKIADFTGVDGRVSFQKAYTTHSVEKKVRTYYINARLMVAMSGRVRPRWISSHYELSYG